MHFLQLISPETDYFTATQFFGYHTDRNLLSTRSLLRMELKVYGPDRLVGEQVQHYSIPSSSFTNG